MQFGSHPQQKVVRGFELFALGFADEFAFFQFAQCPRAIFEERHPQQILKIAQAAAAVLDVRLLHAGGIAEFGMTRLLVGDTLGNVFFLKPVHAFVDDDALKLFEQCLVTDNQARFDERGFGLHVGVGHLHAIVQAADRIADLQADVPKRVEHTVNQLGQVGEWFARRDLAFVQKHEVNVAVRIQFRAAIAADGHQRQWRKLLLRPGRKAALRGLPEVPQHGVEHRGARPADFPPIRAAVVPQFEPVRFHLEKALATRKPFAGVGRGRKGQACLRIAFDFSD